MQLSLAQMANMLGQTQAQRILCWGWANSSGSVISQGAATLLLLASIRVRLHWSVGLAFLFYVSYFIHATAPEDSEASVVECPSCRQQSESVYSRPRKAHAERHVAEPKVVQLVVQICCVDRQAASIHMYKDRIDGAATMQRINLSLL